MRKTSCYDVREWSTIHRSCATTRWCNISTSGVIRTNNTLVSLMVVVVSLSIIYNQLKKHYVCRRYMWLYCDWHHDSQPLWLTSSYFVSDVNMWSKYPNMLRKFVGTSRSKVTVSQASIHVTDQSDMYSEICIVFTRAEALADAPDDQCSSSRSLECASKVKVCFYIVQYPVRWTTQSAVHFSSPDRPVHSDTNSASLWKHSSDAAIILHHQSGLLWDSAHAWRISFAILLIRR